MFCSKCGSPVADDARFCPQCSAPTNAAASGPGVGNKFKGASQDALKTFTKFAVNPVGQLAPACVSLPGKSALAVGIVFGVVFEVCCLLGGLIGARFHVSGLPWQWYVVGILTPALAFASIAAVSWVVRKIVRGTGELNGDCFIAGASLLPLGIFVLLSGILGFGASQISMIIGVFAGCTAILMLFAGCTRYTKMSDLAATLTIPMMAVVFGIVMWILTSIFSTGPMGGMQMGIPMRMSSGMPSDTQKYQYDPEAVRRMQRDLQKSMQSQSSDSE